MTVALLELWWPILASAIVVFFVSFLAHMVLPHHRKDWGKITAEDTLLEFVRTNKPAPGQYMFPNCQNWAELKDPEKKKRYVAGPHGTINIYPGMPNMGRNMGLTFAYYIVIGVFVAYLATQAALNHPADAASVPTFIAVFRFTGTAAVMAYTLASIGNAIWFNQPLKPFLNDLIDGIVYGLATGAVFGFFWPAATAATGG